MKTILAAIDFSPVSQDVVAHAVALAQMCGAGVTLFNAVQPPQVVTDLAPLVGEALQITAEVERASRRQLHRIQVRWADRGVTINPICQQGLAVPMIVALAKELDASYIVLGSHGHTAFYDLVAGSTASGVLKRAPCPVLVVPARGKPKKRKARRAK